MTTGSGTDLQSRARHLAATVELEESTMTGVAYDQKILQNDLPEDRPRRNCQFSTTGYGRGSESPDSFLGILSRLHSYCGLESDRERLPAEKDQCSSLASPEKHSIRRRGDCHPYGSTSRFSPIKDRHPLQKSTSSIPKDREILRKSSIEGLCRSSLEEHSASTPVDEQKSGRLSNTSSESSRHSSRDASPKPSETDDEDIRLLLKRADEVRKNSKMLQAQANLNTFASSSLCCDSLDQSSDIVQVPLTLSSSYDALTGFDNLMRTLSSHLSMPTMFTSDVPFGSPHAGTKAKPPASCGSGVQPAIREPSLMTPSASAAVATLPPVAPQQEVLSWAHPKMKGSSDQINVMHPSKSICDGILRTNDIEESVRVESGTPSVDDALNTNSVSFKETFTSSTSSTRAQGNSSLDINSTTVASNIIPSENSRVAQKSVPAVTYLDNNVKRPKIDIMASAGGNFDHVDFFVECFYKIPLADRPDLRHVAALTNRLLKSKHFMLNEPTCVSMFKIWDCKISVEKGQFSGYGGLSNSAILNALGSAFHEKVSDLRVFARNQGFLGWKLAQKQYRAVSADKKYDALRAKLWIKLNEVFFSKSTSTTYLQKDAGQVVYEKLKEVVGMVLGDANLLVSAGPVCDEVWITLKDGDDEQIICGTHFSAGSACLSLISSMFDVSQQIKFLDDLMLLLGADGLKRNACNQVVTEFYWDLLFARADFLTALFQTCKVDPGVEDVIKGSSPGNLGTGDMLECLSADDAYYYNLIEWILGQKLSEPDSYQIKQFSKMWSISRDRCARSTSMTQILCHQLAGLFRPQSRNHNNVLIDSILKNFVDPKIFITKVCQSSYAFQMMESLISDQSFDEQKYNDLQYYVDKIQDHIGINPHTPLYTELMLGNDARPLVYETASSITGLVLGQAEYQRRATFIRTMCQGDHKDSKLAKIVQRWINPSQFEAVLDVASRDILCVPAIEQLHNISKQEWWHMDFWQHLAEDVVKMPDLRFKPALVKFKLARMLAPKSSSISDEIPKSGLVKRTSKDAVTPTMTNTASVSNILTETPAAKKSKLSADFVKAAASVSGANELSIIAKAVLPKRKPGVDALLPTTAATFCPSGLTVTPTEKKRKQNLDTAEATTSGFSHRKKLVIFGNSKEPAGKSCPGSNIVDGNQKLKNILKFMAQQKVKGLAHKLITSTPDWMKLLELAIQDEELSPRLNEVLSCKDDESPIFISFTKGWKRLRYSPKVPETEPPEVTILPSSSLLTTENMPIDRSGTKNSSSLKSKPPVSNKTLISDDGKLQLMTVSEGPVSDMAEKCESRLAEIYRLMRKHQNGPHYKRIVQTPNWLLVMREVVRNDHFYSVMTAALGSSMCPTVEGISAMKIWHNLEGTVKCGLVSLSKKDFPSTKSSGTKQQLVQKTKSTKSGQCSSSMQCNQTFNDNGFEMEMKCGGSLEDPLDRFSGKDAVFTSSDIAGIFMDCFDRMPTVGDCKTNLNNVIPVVNERLKSKNFQLHEPTFCAGSAVWECCISTNGVNQCLGYGRFLNSAVLNALGSACPERILDLRDFARGHEFVGYKSAQRRYVPLSNTKLEDLLWNELNNTFFLQQTSHAYSHNGCQLVYENLKNVASVVLENSALMVTSGSLCADILIVYKDDHNVENTFGGTHFTTGSACLTLISSIFSPRVLIKFLDDLMILLGAGTLKRDSSNQVAIDFYWDLLLARIDFLKELISTLENVVVYFDEKYLSNWEWIVADDAWYYNLVGWSLSGKLQSGKIGQKTPQLKQFAYMFLHVASMRRSSFWSLSRLFNFTKCHIDVSDCDTLSDEFMLLASFPEIFDDPKIFISKMCQSKYLYMALKFVHLAPSVGQYSDSYNLQNVSAAKDCIGISQYSTVNRGEILGNPDRALLYTDENSICGLALDRMKYDRFVAFIDSICQDRPSSTVAKVIQAERSKGSDRFATLVHAVCRDVLYPFVLERWMTGCSQRSAAEKQLVQNEQWHRTVWQMLPNTPDLSWSENACSIDTKSTNNKKKEIKSLLSQLRKTVDAKSTKKKKKRGKWRKMKDVDLPRMPTVNLAMFPISQQQ